MLLTAESKRVFLSLIKEVTFSLFANQMFIYIYHDY